MSFLNLPISNEYIDIGGLIVLLVVAIGLVYRAERGSFRHFFQWQPIGAASKDGGASSFSVVVPSMFRVLYRDVFAAQVLRTCSRAKRLSHLGLFWGFALLALSTILAFLTNPTNLVLPLWNPVKVSGNVGGVLVLVGFAGMFYARYNERAPIWRLTRSDVFLMILMLAVLTGFVTQQAEYSDAYTSWVSPTFWIHMVFVVGLLATAPFTKFFHAVSKPIALLHEAIDAKSDREPLLPAPALQKGANTD
jgi:nitrate reductase gamma subunit